jgi:MtrB/PioB family decaheme-associated outer membrane protein
MTPNRTTGLLLAAALVLGAAGSTSAQTPAPSGLNTEGSIEAGLRGFLTDGPSNKERAKFDEYRDNSAGPFLEKLQLRIFTGDERYSTEISASKLGRQDQQFSLNTGRTGQWRLEFDYDQILHTFATNARTLEHETSPGVWHAPPIRSLYDFNGQATSRELGDIAVHWYTGRSRFTLTPTPDVDLFLQYQIIRKEGERPFSMVMGTGSGSNFLELLEPIQQTLHEVRLGGTLAREQYQLQFGYTFSAFVNDLQSVTFENPCWQLAAGASGCVGADSGANSRQFGRSSLPPSNMAHTFSLSGGLNLPLRTRFNGSVTYSLMLQDADFLPFATTACATCGQMPQSSLDGNVQTVNVTAGVTSHPFQLPLTLSAKYRLYGLHDESDQIRIAAWILSDRTGDGVEGPTVARRQSYTKQNADVAARYQIVQPVAVTLGAGWEEWSRGPEMANGGNSIRVFDVYQTDEVFLKAAVDATPLDWLLARLTYMPSWKGGDYKRGIPAIGTQIYGYGVRFDEANRDRQRVDFLLQLTPLDTLSITPTAGWRHDDYTDSPFGVQWETSWSAGIDVNWNPTERVSFSAGYVRELNDRNMKSRSSAGTLNNDFISDMTDTVDTFHVSGKLELIPKLLTWTTGANYSTSYGSVKTRNSTGAVPWPATPGLAGRWADVDDQLVRLETKLSYQFAKAWTASLSYAFEQWRHHDFRTDNWLPFNPVEQGIKGDVYLGTDPKNYDAHILAVTLTYRFQ